MDQLVETYKKKNNIKDDNFDNETYEPYNVLSLNNCVYVFDIKIFYILFFSFHSKVYFV